MNNQSKMETTSPNQVWSVIKKIHAVNRNKRVGSVSCVRSPQLLTNK